MPLYQLHLETFIPSDIQAVWAFFSNPRNLARLSPEYLNFRIMYCPETEQVYNGMKIGYTLSPVMHIPLRWESLIDEVILFRQFKDIQTKGPYKLWEHTHIFETANKGVTMKDHVLYRMPYGALGALAHRLFVKKQLNELFGYRAAAIQRLFPPHHASTP